MAKKNHENRKAHGVDPEIKKKNIIRLKRIKGQVEGIQRMVEEDRYCADILTQVSAVQEALRSVSRELLKNHMTHCVQNALKDDAKDSREVINEVIVLLKKNWR